MAHSRPSIKTPTHHPQLHITPLTRPTSTYTAPSPLIRTFTADFTSPASLTAVLQGQDALHDAWKPLIDGAVAAGVKLFFASEFASDIMSPYFAKFPPLFVGDKIRVRGYLEERVGSGEIAWTVPNGGPFFDMYEFCCAPAGFDIPSRKARIYDTSNNFACGTPLPVMGSTNAILEALEAETGEMFTAEHRCELAKAIGGMTINSNFNEEDSVANFWDMVGNELLGVNPVSVGEAVKEAMEKWGKD
ncbi:hypothetical protein V2W45_1470295 [Cenococcum geophilum]